MKEIKALTENDYDAIFELSQFAFQYKLSKEDLDKKKAEAMRHTIWGWMDGEQLAAKLHLIPLSCYINGKLFEMGGISSVATWPEYRRQGMVKHLLHHALQEMKQHGQTVSFLHPFAIPFYRHYGWELTFTEKLYAIPIDKLKRNWDGNGYVRRFHPRPDLSILQSIYTAYAKKFTGTLVRDEQWWKQRVIKDQDHIAVAFNKSGNHEGYIIYHVKDNAFTVTEMAYSSIDGWKLLLQFIANHDSMVEKVSMIVPENDNLPLLVDEPRFEQKINPYFMARIVDVFAFLNQYPFADNSASRTVTLNVTDSFLPENNGTYQLNQTKKGTTVTSIPLNEQTPGIHCTIQILTTMFLGYKRPIELYEVGILQGNKKDVEQLEKLIPKQQTLFADFF